MITKQIHIERQEDFRRSELNEIVRTLRADGVIAYPTETIYGLGGDIRSRRSYERIYDLKGRAKSNRLIVLIPEESWLTRLVDDLSKPEARLIDRFWPGPVTLIFRAGPWVPVWLVDGDGRIAVRQTSHFVPMEIMKTLDSSITSTSANPTGCVASDSARAVSDYFVDEREPIDLLIDSGKCSDVSPSTVVSVIGGDLTVYREGRINRQALEAALG